MKHHYAITLAAATLILYAGAIVVGLHLRSEHLRRADTLGVFDTPATRTPWTIASMASLPPAQRAQVEEGNLLFTETPVYLADYTPSRVACASCHEAAGTAPLASPVVGSTKAYPQFSKRAGRSISLEDRIEECMTRSENGRSLPIDSAQMRALLAYIQWLNTPHPNQLPFAGRGLEKLAPHTPDARHGASLYGIQCAGCHGQQGEGARRPFPPLWGPESFNDGAGMDSLPKLAAFIHTNMPQNRKGILSVQDAFNLAAFLQQQPRPAYNHANDRF